MKKIVLVCSAGMSTSLLVTKMSKAAQEQDFEVDIKAIAEVDLKKYENDMDVLLLGPQVRFLLNKIKKQLEPKGIPVEVIDSINYGTMNGKAVLTQAIELMHI